MKRLLPLCCALFVVLQVPAGFAQAPTNERVMEIVRRTVGSSGNSIVVLGSWVSGKKYGDPLQGGASDHDMRLLLPAGTKEEEAIRQWKAARQALVSEMRKEFGADAGKVLATVNLYPPTQLMKEVEDPADALEAYRRMGVSPKLSYTGPASSIPADAAEGLYGAGADTWTQRYEKTAGKLVYKEGEAVYAGMTDLTHLSEGQGRYTTGGMANTARQWAEHAEEALQSGKGDKVAKYLERMERDIMKARDLQRFDIHGAARDELHSLMQQLRTHPEQLAELEGRVQSVLQRTKIESAVLARVERAGLAQKAVLRTMLGALDTHTALSQALRDAAEKVPADRLVAGIVAFIAVREMSAAAGEGDPAKMLVGAAPWLLPVGPAILAHIAEATIESAKDAGFALMANTQEPFDLLAGIYTAGGRPDPNGKSYTLDQLVAAYGNEAKLRSFVFSLAQRAADRNAGDATAAADMKVADAIVERCFPVILRAWRAKREELAAEYLDLADILRTAAPRLRYQPAPAGRDSTTGKATVTVMATSSDRKFASHRDRMLEILKILYGPGCFISVTDRWQSGGKEGAADNEQVYTFDKDGVHTVQLDERIEVGGGALPRNSPLAFKTTLNAEVEIAVQGVAAVAAFKADALAIDLYSPGMSSVTHVVFNSWTAQRAPAGQFKKPADFARYVWRWEGLRFRGGSTFTTTATYSTTEGAVTVNKLMDTLTHEIDFTGEVSADRLRLATVSMTIRTAGACGSVLVDSITLRNVQLQGGGYYDFELLPDEKNWEMHGGEFTTDATARPHIASWTRTYKPSAPTGDTARDWRLEERDRLLGNEVGHLLARKAPIEKLAVGLYKRAE